MAAVVRRRRVEWHVRDAFADVLRDWPTHTVAVDMPIGTTHLPRAADHAARQWLRDHGGPWQSVFLTPTTETVRAWQHHGDHHRAMADRGERPGTSIQAWNLIPAIVEVEQALRAFPSATVLEAHPECSFRAMDGRIGPASKKTGLGAGLRLRALREWLDLDLAEAPPDVPVDDLLDACAVAWTAVRHARGAAFSLPEGADGAPRIVV